MQLFEPNFHLYFPDNQWVYLGVRELTCYPQEISGAMDKGACGLLLTMFGAEFRIYDGWKTADTVHGLLHWIRNLTAVTIYHQSHPQILFNFPLPKDLHA